MQAQALRLRRGTCAAALEAGLACTALVAAVVFVDREAGGFTAQGWAECAVARAWALGVNFMLLGEQSTGRGSSVAIAAKGRGERIAGSSVRTAGNGATESNRGRSIAETAPAGLNLVRPIAASALSVSCARGSR